ncbi:FCD domain-containing protein [Cupriavidus alkaliphilus]|nr:FCD domain-containing protein [Cupriavidus alkaliphilus]
MRRARPPCRASAAKWNSAASALTVRPGENIGLVGRSGAGVWRHQSADREFNELCLVAARNEFAEGAMRLMHGLSRRFWYLHYKEAADLPTMSKLHAAVASAIARGEVDGAGAALDALLDNIEEFTRATVLGDYR